MDAIEATDLAFYEALAAVDWTVPGVAVHQHAPRNAPRPVVVVGDIEGATPIGRAGDRDMTMTVSVIAVTDDEQRAPCASIIGQAIAALDGKILIVTGWRIAAALIAGSSVINDDGAGYAGGAMFSVTALQA